MDDLISRSALIEKFDADFQAGLIESRDDVIGTIEEAPTADNNGWIPCSERLPEKQSKHQKRRELLVTTNTGIVGVMQFEFKSNDFYEAGDENHLTHWQEDSEGFAVIAWMPLLDPYQSKE